MQYKELKKKIKETDIANFEYLTKYCYKLTDNSNISWIKSKIIERKAKKN